MSSPPKSAAVQEVEALYQLHNPAKGGDVPKLAAKYGDAKLLAMVRKKYGPAPVGFVAVAPQPGAPSAGPSAARLEIDALYQQHNPEKLGDVDSLSAKYGEEKLLTMVRKKYKVAAAPPVALEGSVGAAGSDAGTAPG